MPTPQRWIWRYGFNNRPSILGDNRNYRMSALLPFLALDQPCDQVLAWVNEQLARAGFRVVQTFDLQVARLAHPDCPCPYHGTDQCNCQMIVLLVYRKKGYPAALVIHGQDSRTWISLVNQGAQRAHHNLEEAIRRALIPRLAEISSPIRVAYEVRSTD